MCGRVEREAAIVCIELGRGAERNSVRVWPVAKFETAEYGNAERGESIPEDIGEVPAAVRVVLEARKPTQCDPLDVVECSRTNQLRELSIDLSEPDLAFGFDHEDRPAQIGQPSTDHAGQRSQPPSDQEAVSVTCHFGGNRHEFRVAVQYSGFGRGQQVTGSSDCLAADEAAMYAG